MKKRIQLFLRYILAAIALAVFAEDVVDPAPLRRCEMKVTIYPAETDALYRVLSGADKQAYETYRTKLIGKFGYDLFREIQNQSFKMISSYAPLLS